MMKRLLRLVDRFFKLPFLRELDGNKEVIACLLILFAALDGALLDIIQILPDVPVLEQIQSGLSKVVSVLAKLGEWVGIPALAVGALHRRAKETK
jgi:hypothetical protein